ncbi:hypothetical protein DSO57_1026864 [Entomophthora muscae]|uniref:Uncharacterized protein n=1 Tax=Entomophthora muscae TaxID=34485 RepID=A0ACC2SF87_9FUNG|nr:hypothetical protein DSO57_1026864 [Entomophthora muscae]
MKCPQQFWIAEISICLTHDAGTWCNKWHKEHTEKDWDTFKQDFLARFALKDTTLMIICQVKNLTQTDTVKEFVVNAAIHHVLILPLLGYFEDKSLSFAFSLQNEAGSKLGNTIVWFPDSAQLTCPTHACGK